MGYVHHTPDDQKQRLLSMPKLKPWNGACLATSDLVMDYCPFNVTGYHVTFPKRTLTTLSLKQIFSRCWQNNFIFFDISMVLALESLVLISKGPCEFKWDFVTFIFQKSKYVLLFKHVITPAHSHKVLDHFRTEIKTASCFTIFFNIAHYYL